MKQIISIDGLLGPNVGGIKCIPPYILTVAKALKDFEVDNDLKLVEWKRRPALDFIKDVQRLVPNRERVRGAGFESSRLSDIDELRKKMHRESWEQHNKRFAGLPIDLDGYPVLVPEISASKLVNSVADLDVLLQRFPIRFAFWQYIEVIENGDVFVPPDAEDELKKRYTLYANNQQQKCFDEAQHLIASIGAFEKKFGVPGFFREATTFEQGAYVFDNSKLKAISK